MRQLISKKATAARVDLHEESVMRLVRAGKFPKPIRTGPSLNCRVRFVEDEVEAWISERMAARHAAAISEGEDTPRTRL
jgi:predicted DNA-binding transcriptional regulator AlpA